MGKKRMGPLQSQCVLLILTQSINLVGYAAALNIAMHDVVIIGAGPAGLSAALWCDELGLDTLVLEQKEEVGGQLLSVHNPINNYLGLHADNGRDLRDRFAEQTKDCEFDLWTNVEIESVDLKAKRI